MENSGVQDRGEEGWKTVESRIEVRKDGKQKASAISLQTETGRGDRIQFPLLFFFFSL
jgi:hypothetical protein